MPHCPVPLRVTLGPCGQLAHVDVAREMGFISSRLICAQGHSMMLAVAGLDGQDRDLEPLRQRRHVRQIVAPRTCARAGCGGTVVNPLARFCSHRCGTLASGPRGGGRPRSVWPDGRREAFIADYGARVPLEKIARRYGMDAPIDVTRQAARFRRSGYAVPFLRTVRG